ADPHALLAALVLGRVVVQRAQLLFLGHASPAPSARDEQQLGTRAIRTAQGANAELGLGRDTVPQPGAGVGDWFVSVTTGCDLPQKPACHRLRELVAKK